ncbi:MAG TPA: OmpA family protein [Dongiaceae bacterium]|nr:OmpA family protein [Dongiaceae bacterium]
MRKIFHIAMVALMSVTLSGCLVAESKYLQKEAELNTLTQEQAALQKRHDGLANENAGLKGDLAALTGVRNKLDETVAKLTNDKKELEKDLSSSKGESQQRISELRQKIAAMEAENGRLKEEIAGLQKAKEEVQKASQTYEQLLDKMKSEISQGQVTISELKGKLTVNLVDAILFDSGKAEVKEDGLAVLQKVVDILKTVKDKAIRIEGHTDNVPIRGALTNKYATNWELSAARAINVTRFLQKQGLDPAILVAAAYGENKPVAPNDSEEGKAKNRRIEIVLVAKE